MAEAAGARFSVLFLMKTIENIVKRRGGSLPATALAPIGVWQLAAPLAISLTRCALGLLVGIPVVGRCRAAGRRPHPPTRNTRGPHPCLMTR